MKYLLIIFLGLGSTCMADPQWSAVNVQARDIAFIAGYGGAALYDMGEHKNDKLNPHCVGWKMSLGLLSGLAIAICHASESGSAIQFEDIVFGGLGGLTCVVVHF